MVVSILETLVSSNKALLWLSPTDVQIEGFIQCYLIGDLVPLASRLPADLFNLVGFTVGKDDMKEEIGTLGNIFFMCFIGGKPGLAEKTVWIRTVQKT